MESHLVDAACHRAKASLGYVSLGVHFVRQLIHQRLQPIELVIAFCKITKWR